MTQAAAGWPDESSIEAGTRGWFEVNFQGAGCITIKSDSTVDMEPCQMFWYKTNGQIAGLPSGHPGVLLNEIYLPKSA
jgi:hypothetical protein